MSFELANLVVTIAVNKSGVTAALGQVRAELNQMASVPTPAINLSVGGAENFLNTVNQMRSNLTGLRAPTRMGEDLAATTQKAQQAGQALFDMTPPIQQAQQQTSTLGAMFGGVGAAVRGLFGGIGALLSRVSSLGQSVRQTGQQSINPGGIVQMSQHLESGQRHAGQLLTSLASIGGLDLSSLMQLGTLGGLATGLASVVKQFTAVDDEARVLPMRLASVGLSATDMMGKINEFRNSLAATGMASRQEITAVIEQAAMRGPEKFRGQWQNTVQAAFQLAAATGKSVEYSMQMLNFGQQNYTNMQRMMRLLGIQMRPHATLVEYQEVLNRKIKEGGIIMDAVQNTWKAQIQRIANALDLIRVEIAKLLGPAIAPGLRLVGAVVTALAAQIRQFINDNRAMLEMWAGVAASIMGAVAAILGFKAAMLVWATIGPTVLAALSPLVTVMITVVRATNVFRLALMALFVPVQALRIAIPLLSMAIRGLLTSTGVGAILVLVGGILHATGALEYLIQLVKNLFEAFRGNQVSGIFGMFTRTWAFITKEFMVFRDALSRGFFGVLNALWLQIQRIGNGISMMFGGSKVDFQGWVNFLQGKLRQLGTFLFDIWREIAAEISVAGLRLQQGFLLFEIVAQNVVPIFTFIVKLVAETASWVFNTVIDNIYAIWTIATTVWRVTMAFFMDIIAGLMRLIFRNWDMIRKTSSDTAVAIGKAIMGLLGFIFKWLYENFPKLLNFLLNLVYGMIIQIFEFAWARFKSLWEGMKNPDKFMKKGFDFSETWAEINKTKKAFGDIFSKGFNMPELNLSGPAMDEFNKLQNKIESEKKGFKKEQDRLKQEMEKQRKPLTDKPPPRATEAPLGRQIAGTFSDLMGQWKKIQEAATGGRINPLEELGKRQVKEQREGNVKLDEIAGELRKLNNNQGVGGPQPPIPQ